MDREKATKLFFQMEKELDLFDKELEGVFFWERVRTSVYNELLDALEIHQNSSFDKKNRILLERMIGLMKNIFYKNPFLADGEVLFFGQSRRKQRQGRWWDIYVDPIIDSIDIDYCYLEDIHPHENKHLTPAKTEEIRYLDLINFGAAIPRRLNLFGKNKDFSDSQIINEIENRLRKEFGVEIDIVSKTEHTINRRRHVLPLYRILLKKVKPKAVFIVKTGRFSLIEACKVLDIPVIELQHGFLSETHPDYEFHQIDKRKLKYKPDQLLLWGNYWSKKCNLPQKEKNILYTGFPNLEQRVQEYDNEEKSIDLLFISQWSIGEELSKMASHVARQTDLEIVYKLHPGEYREWQDKYPWLENSNIRIVKENTPLYELFGKSRAQVGVYSTALYEGLAFNLFTYIYKIEGHNQVKDLTKYEGISLIGSADELKSKFNDQEQKPNIETEAFFQKDSLEKIQKVLEMYV